MNAPATLAPIQPAQGVWERIRHDRALLASSGVLAFIALACIFGPLLSPHDPATLDWSMMSAPPDLASGHWFGTDALGRDLFARTLAGGRVSLAIGLAATGVSLLIGIAWGATAGYVGGRTDMIMMRAVDILYAMPFMFFVILLMVFFGRDIVLVFIAVGAVNWLDMARIVRGQTLSLKEKEFILAARAMGLGTPAIIARHIVPNVLGIVVAYATLTVPQVILVESFLSFLGLGVQEPATSWGALVNEGAREMELSPWALLFPAGFLVTTLFCLNFMGNGLRDALDPKEKR